MRAGRRGSLVSVVVAEGGGGAGSGSLRSAWAAQTLGPVEPIPLARWHRRDAAARRAGQGRYLCWAAAGMRPLPVFLEVCLFLLESVPGDVIAPPCEGLPPWFVCRGELLPDSLALRPAPGAAASDHAWRWWLRLLAGGARVHRLSDDQMLASSPGPNRPPPIGAVALTRRPRRRPRSLPAPRSRPLGAWQRKPAGPSLLLAVPYLSIGGSERLTSGVIADLAARGWQVAVAASLPLTAELRRSARWFRQATDSLFALQDFLAPAEPGGFLEHLIRSRRIDVLWISGSTVAYGQLERLRRLFPALKVADILYNPVGHLPTNRAHAASIDVTIVESVDMAETLRAHGEPPDRIAVIPSAVILDTARRRPRAEVRDGLGLPAGALVVGFMGRLAEEKSPETFVEAAALLGDEAGLHFLMCGDGPLAPEVEGRIAELRPPRFRLLGEVDCPADILGALDILVLPSRLDGSPMVVREAMSLGVAVVAAAVGGIPELIEDGVTGRLVPPADAAACAAAVGRLAADRAALARIKAAAASHAARHFQRERMLAGYRALFGRLCEGSAP
jgi:glycosyltransferase involved in cell wall biosynthesis